MRSKRTISDCLSTDLTEKFWRAVQKTDTCWLWTGARLKAGYGSFWLDNDNKVLVHRFSWHLANGPIPSDQWVLHHCDTPPCVRPDHLFLGTQQANMRDMHAKGRGTRGERSNLVKLRETDVLEIYREYATGQVTQKALATRYGVAGSLISLIVRGQAWGHLNLPVLPPRVHANHGNHAKGERQGRAKLTATQVVAIRARAAAGERAATLAPAYGVAHSLISLILTRRIWKHI